MTKTADVRASANFAILIAGPTASGKSSLAVEIGRAFDGVVINADSMQVYRDLAVLTARPSPEEQAGVPHALYGYVDAADAYSVADWCEAAGAEIRRCWTVGRLPIVTGGTGLYFRSLLQGIAQIPEIPVEIRSAVRDRIEREGTEAIYGDLMKFDPEGAARLSPRDRQRIARAMEVVMATGKPLAHWQRQTAPGVLAGADESGTVLKFVLSQSRETLYARIEKRFDGMIDAGATAEVRSVLARNLATDRPAMKALGVPQLASWLAGQTEEATAIDLAKQETRRYAKRQMTWFRNQFADWEWVDAQFSESIYDEIFPKIRKLILTSQD